MQRRRLGLALFSLFAAAASRAEPPPANSVHVVEELTFRVAPADHDDFLRYDREIWTETLSRQPGYLGKETWLASRPQDEIKLVIRWRTRKDWNRVPKDLLEATDKRFAAAMGKNRYELLRGRAFRATETAPNDLGVPIDAVLTAQNLTHAKVIRIKRDPVYFRPKRYLAVPLRPALEGLANGLDRSQRAKTQLVFDCADNYHSKMPLDRALAGDAWIAFRDLEAADGESWVTRNNGPSPAKMGRAYLIWPDFDDPASVTWPYGIQRLRLVTQSE